MGCAVAVFAGLGAGSAGAAPADWTVQQTPEIKPGYIVHDVATNFTDDAVAVGYVLDQQWAGTVALHWDGKQWKRQPTPEGQALLGAASNGAEKWAVGIASEKETLIARWEGQKWQRVPSPTPANLPATASPALTSIKGYGDDFWAAGCAETDEGTNGTGMLQHWDGKEWKAVDLPTVDGAKYICPDEINQGPGGFWAVGHIGTDQGARPFAMRLVNGTRWEVVPVPDADPNTKFTGVASMTGVDGKEGAVVSGMTTEKPGDPTTTRPIIQRWDGKTWTTMTHPLGKERGLLQSMTPGTGGKPLAAGYTTDNRPIMLRWNGTEWTSATGGLPASAALFGLETPASGRANAPVWTVGDTGDPGQGLIASDG